MWVSLNVNFTLVLSRGPPSWETTSIRVRGRYWQWIGTILKLEVSARKLLTDRYTTHGSAVDQEHQESPPKLQWCIPIMSRKLWSVMGWSWFVRTTTNRYILVFYVLCISPYSYMGQKMTIWGARIPFCDPKKGFSDVGISRITYQTSPWTA